MPEMKQMLRTIVERASSASEGPWKVELDPDGIPFIRTGERDRENRLLIKYDDQPANIEDVTFIALSRNIIPRLVTALQTDEIDHISLAELDRVEMAASQASPGPWTAFIEEEQPIGGCSMIWLRDEGYGPDMYVWLGEEIAPAPDIKFIANARQDMPILINEYRNRSVLGCRTWLAESARSASGSHLSLIHWARP